MYTFVTFFYIFWLAFSFASMPLLYTNFSPTFLEKSSSGGSTNIRLMCVDERLIDVGVVGIVVLT